MVRLEHLLLALDVPVVVALWFHTPLGVRPLDKLVELCLCDIVRRLPRAHMVWLDERALGHKRAVDQLGRLQRHDYGDGHDHHDGEQWRQGCVD